MSATKETFNNLYKNARDLPPIEQLKSDLNLLIKSIPGLLAVLIVDKVGIPLIDAHQDIVPELALKPSFLSMAVSAAEHVAKLGFGKCNTIYCDYENYQVVTFVKVASSLMVTLIAESRANTGMLLALSTEFDTLVNELRRNKLTE